MTELLKLSGELIGAGKIFDDKEELGIDLRIGDRVVSITGLTIEEVRACVHCFMSGPVLTLSCSEE